MRLSLIAALALILAAPFAPALAERTPAPPGAAVYMISPEDGAVITGPVVVRFGLSGMGVAPAGIAKEKTGHHHLLLNTPMLEGDDLNYPIPADDNHIHFGGGQTETTLELEPGSYTMQLLVGDENHIPHEPPIASEVITITVK